MNVDRGLRPIDASAHTRPGRRKARRTYDGIRAASHFRARCRRRTGVSGGESGRRDRAGDGPLCGRVIPTDGGDVLARIYRAGPPEGLPVVVYFHGGGWVVGSVVASDPFCRRLAREAGCVVVSVDYPLAPENPYPAAVRSSIAAIKWASERAGAWGGDRERLVVFGDSAGGIWLRLPYATFRRSRTAASCARFSPTRRHRGSGRCQRPIRAAVATRRIGPIVVLRKVPPRRTSRQ